MVRDKGFVGSLRPALAFPACISADSDSAGLGACVLGLVSSLDPLLAKEEEEEE